MFRLSDVLVFFKLALSRHKKVNPSEQMLPLSASPLSPRLTLEDMQTAQLLYLKSAKVILQATIKHLRSSEQILTFLLAARRVHTGIVYLSMALWIVYEFWVRVLQGNVPSLWKLALLLISCSWLAPATLVFSLHLLLRAKRARFARRLDALAEQQRIAEHYHNEVRRRVAYQMLRGLSNDWARQESSQYQSSSPSQPQDWA